MSENVTETRKFSVHPQIIFDLIKSQAGTLAKGFLECAMNSVDAGATSVHISFDQNGFVVSDNGTGFNTRAEIEKWFEVFGFPHTDEDRVYGKFGIGRAQLWAFASTTWKTNTFKMDVDIQNSGLDYDLVENQSPFNGVQITGKFYEPLMPSDVVATARELGELAKYVNIPVMVNGKNISADPSKEKWTHDTPEAWISLNPSAHHLEIYNLGVLVCRMNAYSVGGCGGKIVTKPGVKLSLNMARNDILVSQCTVWKKIKPFLRKESDKIRVMKARLTEDDRQALADQFLAGELEDEDTQKAKMFTDINGRHYTIRELRKAADSYNRTYTTAEDGSQLADRAHGAKMVFVVSGQTLVRFNVDTMKAFGEILQQNDNGFSNAIMRKYRFIETIAEAVPTLSDGHAPVPYNDTTKQERAALKAMQTAQNIMGAEYRRIHAGISDVAEAWTDGTRNIWINRKLLNKLSAGLSGAHYLSMLLLHEMGHEGPNTGTHAHDFEFYQRYHEASFKIGELSTAMIRKYVSACNQYDIKVNRKTLNDLDLTTYGDEEDADDEHAHEDQCGDGMAICSC